MNNIAVRHVAKFMRDWIPKEASVAISDKDKYLDYYAGIHDIQIRPGQPIPSGSISDRVNRRKERIETLIDESVFGIPYYGIGYLVGELDDKIGVLTVILPPSFSFSNPSPISFLTGKQGELWSPIPVEEITYIESNHKKTWFYHADGQYSTVHTLKSLEHRLPNSFLRIHRSYIVNISYIRSISRDMSSNLVLTLKDDSVLTVSQSYIHHVRRVLGF